VSEHTDTLVEIRLLGVDLEVHRRSSEHHEELFREFMIIAGSGDDHATVPARLMALVDELTSQYAGFTGGTNDELQAALERGDRTIDLVFTLPATVEPDVRRFLELLDEADEYCRSGDLLTLAPAECAIAYRRWYLEEFVRQIEGEAPRPWPTVREAGA
jgi:hypothetical protein